MLTSPKNILLIKPSSLGDIIHALPTLAVLRKSFPHAKISWLVKKEWASILFNHPLIDEVIEVEFKISKILAAIKALRARHFDLVLDLQGLFRSGGLSWLSGATTRIGFEDAREGSTIFYTTRVLAPMRGMHAVDRCLRLVGALGVPHCPPEFPLPNSPDEHDRVHTLLARVGLDDRLPIVGIAPSARWRTKRWAPQSYAAVADQLQQSGHGQVVFIGGSQEREEIAHVRRTMHTESADVTGQTMLNELPSILRKLDLLITNDSGPMHVAAAVGTPVVAIFGPTSDACTGPYGDGHTVLRSSVPCRPCFRRQCHNPNINECLTTITVDEVIQASRLILQRTRGESHGN